MHFDQKQITFILSVLAKPKHRALPRERRKEKIKTPPSPKMTHQIDLFGFGRRCAAGGGDGGRTQRSVLLQQAALV